VSAEGGRFCLPPGSAHVSPKQALPLKVGAQGGCEFLRKVRDPEDALANTRDACATQALQSSTKSSRAVAAQFSWQPFPAAVASISQLAPAPAPVGCR